MSELVAIPSVKIGQLGRKPTTCRIVEESPRAAAVAGSNFADVAIVADENSVAVMVAIDNLGKGMAGQAVQSMNIALGLSETIALWSVGRFLI